MSVVSVAGAVGWEMALREDRLREVDWRVLSRENEAAEEGWKLG